MTRQPSRPRVITAPSPRRSRNLAGIASRPLLSTLWVYSPRNIVLARWGLSPFGPTYPHVYPQWSQYTPLRRPCTRDLPPFFAANFRLRFRCVPLETPSGGG